MFFIQVIVAMLAMALAPAQYMQQIDIMILGTFHFENPGQDLHNFKADDVLKLISLFDRVLDRRVTC